MKKRKLISLTTIILFSGTLSYAEIVKLKNNFSVDKDSKTDYEATIELRNANKCSTKNWDIEFDLDNNQKLNSVSNAEFNIHENHVIIYPDKSQAQINPNQTYKVKLFISGTGPREVKNLKSDADTENGPIVLE